MAKQQIYPGASTAHWYQDDYPGDRMDSNVIVWHGTEGTSLPDYGGGASAPNFTAVPDFKAKKLVWHQHFNVDVSSRALRNQSGGVETNTLNACQVEVVGTCDPKAHAKWSRTPHLYLPELPDWAIRDLAAFSRWMRDEHGVPLTSGLEFKAYPGSFGNTDTRMTGAEWSAFKGHCGHQHVPENDHGDPGNWPMEEILKLASGKPVPPVDPKPEPPVVPTVSLAHVKAAAERDPSAPQGSALHKAEVMLVEKALVATGFLHSQWVDGSYGTKTIAAYAALQKHLGYVGSDADGKPGPHSLLWLGLRTKLFRKVN